MKHALLISAIGALFLVGCSSQESTSATTGTTPGPSSSAEGSGATVAFADVQTILNSKCIGCHGEGGKAGLDLRSYATLMKGGEDGAVVKAGDPEGSKIIEVLKSDDVHKRMPLNQPALPAGDIAKIADWIKAGAKEG